MNYRNSSISLRQATTADLALLEHWDQQPHVMAAIGSDDTWLWEEQLKREPAWRELLIAELTEHGCDARPIGFMQIIDPALDDSHYWGDVESNLRALDIWIGEADDLGQGYGWQMMQQAIRRCFANPLVTAILIDPQASNTRAHRFYRRLGFRFLQKRVFGKNECCVFRLLRADVSILDS